MELTFTLTEVALLVGGLVVASIIAGTIAGLLGVGGGIVLVPVMFWLFTVIAFPEAIAAHMAVATSLATIVFTSISSMRAHHKRGAVDFGLLKRWGPALAIGALSGGLAARFFNGDVLTGVFGIVGLRRTRDPAVGGKGLAVAGIALGGIGVVMSLLVFPLVLGIMLPSLNRARETANRVKCAANMRALGQAMLLYASNYRGQYPPGLPELIIDQQISAEVFICPSGDLSPAIGTPPAQRASAPWLAGQIRPLSSPAAWIAASRTPGEETTRPSRDNSPTATWSASCSASVTPIAASKARAIGRS